MNRVREREEEGYGRENGEERGNCQKSEGERKRVHEGKREGVEMGEETKSASSTGVEGGREAEMKRTHPCRFRSWFD